jgi:hypothetical protein
MSLDSDRRTTLFTEVFLHAGTVGWSPAVRSEDCSSPALRALWNGMALAKISGAGRKRQVAVTVSIRAQHRHMTDI